MSADLYKRMKERYGELWHLFPPPEAQEVSLFEHFTIPDVPQTEIDTIRCCNYSTSGNAFLVIFSYGVEGFVDVPNEYYVGTRQIPLSAVDLAGRLSWRLDRSRNPATQNQSVLRTGSVYQNNALSTLLPAEYKQDISVLRRLGEEPHAPAVIIEPGKNTSIFVDFHDSGFGSTPPLSGQGMFFRGVASIRAFLLEVPGK